MSKARIYRPAKNAMQSGKAKTNRWLLKYVPESRKTTDELIGWVGSTDMKQEITLNFDTKEAAVRYAQNNNIEFEVIEPNDAKLKIKSYAENFTG